MSTAPPLKTLPSTPGHPLSSPFCSEGALPRSPMGEALWRNQNSSNHFTVSKTLTVTHKGKKLGHMTDISELGSGASHVIYDIKFTGEKNNYHFAYKCNAETEKTFMLKHKLCGILAPSIIQVKLETLDKTGEFCAEKVEIGLKDTAECIQLLCLGNKLLTKEIIHNDIKPSNMGTNEMGKLLLIDWGYAKTVQDPLISAGTPFYMHPQLLLRLNGTMPENTIYESTDLYSIGISILESLLPKGAQWSYFTNEDYTKYKTEILTELQHLAIPTGYKKKTLEIINCLTNFGINGIKKLNITDPNLIILKNIIMNNSILNQTKGFYNQIFCPKRYHRVYNEKKEIIDTMSNDQTKKILQIALRLTCMNNDNPHDIRFGITREIWGCLKLEFSEFFEETKEPRAIKRSAEDSIPPRSCTEKRQRVTNAH